MPSKPWYPLTGVVPTDAEFTDMMRRADLWPAHTWCRREATALALVNRQTGAMGVIFNVPYRDRLTVYEVNIFMGEDFRRVAATTGPSGVPEHKYIDYEGMFDAGWRPD